MCKIFAGAGILLGYVGMEFFGMQKVGRKYVGYIYPSPYDANTLKHQYWVVVGKISRFAIFSSLVLGK